MWQVLHCLALQQHPPRVARSRHATLISSNARPPCIALAVRPSSGSEMQCLTNECCILLCIVRHILFVLHNSLSDATSPPPPPRAPSPCLLLSGLVFPPLLPMRCPCPPSCINTNCTQDRTLLCDVPPPSEISSLLFFLFLLLRLLLFSSSFPNRARSSETSTMHLTSYFYGHILTSFNLLEPSTPSSVVIITSITSTSISTTTTTTTTPIPPTFKQTRTHSCQSPTQ